MAAPPRSSGWSILGKIALGCGVLVVLTIGGCVLAFTVLREPIKEAGRKLWTRAQEKVTSDPAYAEAMRRAAADARVREKLGEPIEGGMPEQFQVGWDNGTRRTDLAFPIHGPRGEGRIELKATGKSGSLAFERLHVWIGGEGFDLSADPTALSTRETVLEETPTPEVTPEP